MNFFPTAFWILATHLMYALGVEEQETEGHVDVHIANDGLNNTDNLTNIHVAILLPMTGPWPGGLALLSSYEVALNMINTRDDILSGYRIVAHYGDTMCNPGSGINAMHEMVFTPPTKLMVLGGSCSPVTEVTAQVSHHWNLVQISHGSVSPALSNRKKFPKFFRTAASQVDMNPVRINLMRHFNWKKVAVIQESLFIFTSATYQFLPMFTKENFTLIHMEIFDPAKNPSEALDAIIRSGARIIFGGVYEDRAMHLFCLCYQRGFYGSRVQWIINGWFDDNWFTKQDPSKYNCTLEQIKTAMNGYIATGAVYANLYEQRGLANITVSEFREKYNRHVQYKDLWGQRYAEWVFDCMWAVADCLNRTAAELTKQGKRLEDFTYSDLHFTDLVFKKMSSTNFIGTRGEVMFDETGTAISKVRVAQFQNGEVKTIGAFSADEEINEKRFLNPFVWNTDTGFPPLDGPIIKLTYLLVDKKAYAAMSVLSSLGILIAIGFLFFNIKYKSTRYVKMSSPNINSLILIGCMFNYAAVFCAHTSSAHDTVYICTIRNFLLVSGFSLAFGALFSKTYRVHYIFTDKDPHKRKVIKDKQLLGTVLLLFVFNAFIFILWVTISPATISTVRVTSQAVAVNEDLINQPLIDICVSTYEMYFVGTLYVIQGLLLFIGAFLAWETRKVKIEALNDSQQIGVCIYNAVVLSLMAVAISYLVNENPTVKYVLMSLLIVLGTTITQGLLFIPKVYRLRSLNAQVGDATINSIHKYSYNKGDDTRTEDNLATELKICKEKLKEYEKKFKS